MEIIKSINLNKYKVTLISLIIFSVLQSTSIYAQFADIIPSNNTITSDVTSGEKPQSKIWKHDNIWWAVISVSNGTYIYHLSNNTWVQGLKLTSLNKFKADTKVDGDQTHILLFRNETDSKFITVEYVAASKEYIIPGAGPGLVDLTLGPNPNIATIDKDSNGRIWLAYDAETVDRPNKHDILVQWSDAPYSTWNGPYFLGLVNFDDICSVTSFTAGGTSNIGILWSNQTVNKFKFKYHKDGNDPTSWSKSETPASLTDIADNHMNFAVHSNGTIYAGIKTSIDDNGEMTIGLLVRKPDKTWNIYNVTTGSGTRPIALLDESNNRVYVLYTKSMSGGNDIVYRYSNADNISFSTNDYLIDGGTHNNVTSTKQNFSDEVVVFYSNGFTWKSVTLGNDILNGQPVIDPIATQNMTEEETLIVSIYATDPEDDAIDLSVNNLPPFGSFTDNGDGTGSITFTPDINDNGTYSNIEVIAEDDGIPQASSSEFFTLEVANLNRKPVLDLITNQSMDENDTLEVNVSSTDPDGDNITLTASNVPSFGDFTDNGDGTGSFSFLPSYTDAGSYPGIKVIATDDGTPNLSDTAAFTLTVSDVNGKPSLNPITDKNMNEGDTLDVGVNSTDPDVDNIILTTSNVPSFGSFTDNGDGTGMFSFVTGFGDAGSYPGIQVIATDDGTPNLSDTTTFTLTVGDVNRAPQLDPITDKNMNEGDTLGVNVNSTDSDGDNITLTASNVPSFGSFTDNGDGTGMFSFVTGFGDAGSYPDIQVIATDDGTPNLSDTTTFTLTVGDVNRAPSLDPITDKNMNEGDTLGVDVNATDPDGDNITLTASNVPSFGSFTDNGDGTGMFSFLTGFGDAGSYPGIQVIATDDGTPNLSDTTTFTLTVGDVNRAPQLDPITDKNMNEGDTLDAAVSSTDPDGDNITLTASNLPLFGSFIDNGDGTGIFSFLPGPGDAGTYSDITVVAADDGTPSLTDTTMFTLTVGIEAISDPANLVATAPVADQVQLSWADGSDNEDGFIIEREDPDNPGYKAIDTVSAGTVAYTDTTVMQGKRYNYRVKGYNAFTESGYAGPTGVVTLLPAPSGLTGQVLGGLPWSIQLDWVDNSSDELLFVIERDSAGSGFVVIDTVSADVTTYTDNDIVAESVYDYTIYAITSDTMSTKSDTVSVFPTDVIDITSGLIPTEYKLEQNYPNPFNPSTTIRFALPFESNVKLEIFNVIGELVTVLIDNESIDAGINEIEFNASNLPSGIYLYRIIASDIDGTNSDFVKTNKMILVK